MKAVPGKAWHEIGKRSPKEANKEKWLSRAFNFWLSGSVYQRQREAGIFKQILSSGSNVHTAG